ncbi:MAG: DUF6282 family protein [Planctomycetota bacterium]|nr:DUF6282 family protein [Planctomycetota bacterium]
MSRLTTAHLSLSICLVGLAATATAQEPTTLKGNPLVGLIDFHVHSGPDSFTRSTTDFEIARIARARKMGALVLKNHFTMTADRAVLAERATGQRCYGGIVLNRAVGGLNAEAIRRMVTFTGDRGKVVWLPTFDAANHVRRFEEKRPAVEVVRDGKPVAALAEIFSLCAKHDLVLETGHSSATECLVLLAAARRAGVKKLIVTHAMADPIRMTIPQMKQAAKLGAKLECVWMTNLAGPTSHLASMRLWKKVTTADYARAIKAVGTDHFLLSSDLGQYLNPIPTDGMKRFALELAAEGFSRRDILKMGRDTPAALLGMTKIKDRPNTNR